MPFAKGKSGNPKGRPPKARALATLLEKTAKAKPDGLGGRTHKEVFAERVWQALTTGVIEYPPGLVLPGAFDQNGEPVPDNAPRVMQLGTGDFIALARIVLTHLDGPVQAAGDTNINVSAQAAKSAVIHINTRPARTEPPALDDVDMRDDDDDV